jgi:phosphoribosylformylglycinamidine (FGAM) synthase-like enzyme
MPIDKIIGQPTNSTINLLKQQVTKIAAAVKTTSWGRRHGHLILILTDDKYRLVTGNATQATTCLVAPPIVPTALANNTTLTLCANITADHNLECQEYWKQEAVNAVIVDKIVRKGINAWYIKELNDNFIGYITPTVKSLIVHLRR